MSAEERNDVDIDLNISYHDKCRDRVNVKRRRQCLIRFRRKQRALLTGLCFVLFIVVAIVGALKQSNNITSDIVASRGSPRRARLRRGNVPIYNVPFVSLMFSLCLRFKPQECFGLWKLTFFMTNSVLFLNSAFLNPKKNEQSVASQAVHLIIVAGHSVLIGNNGDEAATNENVWHLLDYQRGQGLPQSIVAHITAGIAEASRDPGSLLVFSGGETRADGTGPYSEGSSYFRVADALRLWEQGSHEANGGITEESSNVRARTVTEEFATDSFENM